MRGVVLLALLAVAIPALALVPRGPGPSASNGPLAAAISPPSATVADASGATPAAPSPTSPPLLVTAPPLGTRDGPPLSAGYTQPLPVAVPVSGFVLHVPILMYHRVVPPAQAGDSLPGLVVSPQLLDAQLRALHAAGWRSITVAQLFADLRAGRAVPPRTFAVTFDDGWADGYRYALPILQRYGDHATFYVIAGRVGPGGSFLSSSQLRALIAAGMEIGDHTMDHVSLTGLSPARLRYEILGAAQRLAQLDGVWPLTFAYPAGRFDPAVELALAQDGFGLAVTTRPGAVEAWWDRFAIPRIRVGPGTSPGALLALLRRSSGSRRSIAS